MAMVGLIILWALVSVAFGLGWIFLIAGAVVRMRRGRPWKGRVIGAAVWLLLVVAAVALSWISERRTTGSSPFMMHLPSEDTRRSGPAPE